MEKDSITVKLTAKDLFEFNMFHTYTHSQGIVSLICGFGAIGLAIAGRQDITVGMFLLRVLLGLAILIYIPCTLALRAKAAVKTGGSFEKPVHITIGDDGVGIAVGDQSNQIAWDGIYRLKNRKNQFLIYTGRITALIIPKRCISEDQIKRVQKYYDQHEA